MQDSASFWMDIKNLEDQLVKSPSSFCFAKLAEVYLKVGLVDDALHVARQGVKKHPGYLSGQRVFAQICNAKGFNDEALAALKLVTEALPEDIPSQKLLGRLLVEAGFHDDACMAFRTVLEFAPDDAESRIELESLVRSTERAKSISQYNDEETIIEDIEVLEEIDVVEDDESEPEPQSCETAIEEADSIASLHNDPLSTSTLAELYVVQGFTQKALEIYRAILADNPADQRMAERVAELEVQEVFPSEQNSEIDYAIEEEVEESDAGFPVEIISCETETVGVPENNYIPVFDSPQTSAATADFGGATPIVPTYGMADNALAALERWLENIRRMKSCR